jgi:hypothetical protein
MPAMAQRDLISRLADRGEEMLSKFSDTPGAARVVELLTSTRERLDDLQKRVIGLENLERRLDEVERRLDAVEQPGGAAGTAKPPAKAEAKKPKSPGPKHRKPPENEV